MGNRPLYQGHGPEIPSEQGNPGLKYFRFFDGYTRLWEVKVTKSQNPKLDFIKRFARPTGEEAQLTAVYQRRKTLSLALQAQERVFQLDGPFVTGLGLEHPVENGFLWHHTLGTPYIPGSTLKGLLRAWLETWAGIDRDKVAHWFGAGSDGRESETGRDRLDGGSAGSLIFFDAVPIKPVVLASDVMTPHMAKWYEQGHRIQNINTDHEKIPADWHDPVPVPFLVIREGSFHFMIAALDPGEQEALAEVMEHLETALATVGIGAKTAAGYGRFSATSGAASDRQEAVSLATPEPDPEAVARVEARYEQAAQYPEAIQPWVRMAKEPGGRDRLLQQAEEWLTILENMEPLHRESIEFFANWLNESLDGLINNPEKKRSGKKRKPRQIAIAKRMIALRNKAAEPG